MKGRVWSEEEKTYLIDRYEMSTANELSQILCRTPNAIRLEAQKLGLTKLIRWTDKDKQLLADNYSSLSNSDLSQLLGKSISTIRTYGMEYGKDDEYISKINSQKSKKYSLNDNYFKDINAISSYWLGMLWADGCVYIGEGKHFMVKLTLHEQDISSLEQFKLDLELSAPLYRAWGSRCFNLQVRSKIMCNDLIKLGVTPRKTYSKHVPFIPEDYQSHFVRGVFDGDGSVTAHRTKGTYSANIVNSEEMCKEILLITRQHIGIGGGVYNMKDCHAKMWQIGGKQQVIKFANWLYGDASRYLVRKRNKFIELLGSAVI